MSDNFSPAPDAPALVIGAAGLDIVGRLKGELNPGTSTPAQIRTTFGGVARNVAENLARLGQPVRLITAVGEDDRGDRLIEQAIQAGVDVSAVLRSETNPTSTYLAVIDSQGQLQFALDDMRAMTDLSAEVLQGCAHLFSEASLVFVDANLPKETLRATFALARKARLPICADPATVGLAPKLKPYLSHLTMITPNSAEASVYCDPCLDISNRRDALEAAKSLVARGVQIAIITRAEQGLCYATSETSGYIPAIRTQIVDPTGAGDALTAAVLFALLNDIDLDEAVRLGVSAASLTLRHRGAVVPNLSLQSLYDGLVI
jgi:pseudouridine kinase